MKTADQNRDGEHESSFRSRKSISPGKVSNTESWVALCAQAAVEQDPKKLLELVSEINRLLDARRKRLANEGRPANGRTAEDAAAQDAAAQDATAQDATAEDRSAKPGNHDGAADDGADDGAEGADDAATQSK